MTEPNWPGSGAATLLELLALVVASVLVFYAAGVLIRVAELIGRTAGAICGALREKRAGRAGDRDQGPARRHKDGSACRIRFDK